MAQEYKIRVQIIATAEDDGSDAANVTASQVTSRLNTANQVFAPAIVEFLFDEAGDFLKVNSTLLNRDFTPLEEPNVGSDKWDHEPLVDTESHAEARRELAKQFQGKLVIIYRNRKKLQQEDDTGHWKVVSKGGGSSGSISSYVNMSTSSNGDDLAHEMGHYLQLPHPFAGGVETVADAAEKIRKYVEDGHPKNEGMRALDGDRDWVLDTPADAKGSIFVSEGLEPCGDVGEISIPVTFSDGSSKTYTLKPNRDLVMSYFKGCPGDKTISPEQARRLRDGLELRVRRDLISAKPSFDYNLVRSATETAGTISELSIATVREGRAVTAVRDSEGNLKVIVWDINAGGAITRRGSGSAGTIGKVSVCSVGLNMVATAVRDGQGELTVIIWRVSENGDVTRLETARADGQITDVAASFIARNHIATASRQADDTLRMDVWYVPAEGSIKHKATDTAGKVNVPSQGINTPRLALSEAASEGVVTYVRSENLDLKAILWTYKDSEFIRVGSASLDGAPVGSISGCAVARETSVAAIQDKNKQLKLVAYRFPQDGEDIEKRDTAGAGAIGEVAICRLGTEMVVTGVRDGADKLKVILWQVTKTGDHITRLDDAGTDEGFSRLAMCQTGRKQFITAVRDSGNKLKIISWIAMGTLINFDNANAIDDDFFKNLLAKAPVTANLAGGPTKADVAAGGECDNDGT